MINFEEELKKFQPCLEVDLTDVIDILKEMIKDNSSTSDKQGRNL